MRYVAFILAGLVWVTCAWSVSVENVRFQQTADDQVVVTYDIEVGQRPVEVELWVSQDGGRTYTMEPQSVSGDVGAEVRSGRGKRIVWDVFSDIRKLEGNAFVFKVVVIGGLGKRGEITVDLPGGAQMEFVWIEPGTFTMGSPYSESGRDDDERQYSVTITQGFYLGKYEITQEQWTAVTGDRPWRGEDYVKDNDAHPAVHISWEDVQAFIKQLNVAEGKAVYRLPTEAEWEYSCRAGTTTRWSFGDNEGQLDWYAWYDKNAWEKSVRWGQPVGTKLPNPWSLHDMHGNVWEWVQDWYSPYPNGPVADPTGPSIGSTRVFRGGDFSGFAHWLRSAFRSNSIPSSRGRSIGARLLRTQ